MVLHLLINLLICCCCLTVQTRLIWEIQMTIVYCKAQVKMQCDLQSKSHTRNKANLQQQQQQQQLVPTTPTTIFVGNKIIYLALSYLRPSTRTNNLERIIYTATRGNL